MILNWKHILVLIMAFNVSNEQCISHSHSRWVVETICNFHDWLKLKLETCNEKMCSKKSVEIMYVDRSELVVVISPLVLSSICINIDVSFEYVTID